MKRFIFANLCSFGILLLLSGVTEIGSYGQVPPSAGKLRDGDRVVFYGDSITAQRLYTRFVEDFFVSRYPSLDIRFLNAGVSGDTVQGGSAGDLQTRLRRDVFPFRPTLVTVMLGMNDGRYRTDHPEDMDAFRRGYLKIIESVQDALPGAAILGIRPSPYDEIAHVPRLSGYNGRLFQFGDDITRLAKEKNFAVCDLNSPMEMALHKGMQENPQLAGSLLPDRIHPSETGHWILAVALARCLRSTAIVSQTVLDAASGKTVSAKRTSISELQLSANGMSWTQQDEALPLPLELNNPEIQFLLSVSDLKTWDLQLLQIHGLSAGRYRLSIDGELIASFTKEELDAGVNLALLETPMEKQSRAIDWKADSRSKLSATRFNLLTTGEEISGSVEALRVLDSLDERMLAEERKAAQPKPHRFLLSKEIY